MNRNKECQINPKQEWATATGKKRQRNSPEVSMRNPKQTKINSYWLSKPVSTSNRFDVLSDVDQPQTSSDPVERN